MTVEDMDWEKELNALERIATHPGYWDCATDPDCSPHEEARMSKRVVARLIADYRKYRIAAKELGPEYNR